VVDGFSQLGSGHHKSQADAVLRQFDRAAAAARAGFADGSSVASHSAPSRRPVVALPALCSVQLLALSGRLGSR
jgi:hypothetical protein